MYQTGHEHIEKILLKMKEETKNMLRPMSFYITEHYGRNPFLILISCLLSLRAKDTATLPIALKLFQYATTPYELLNLDRSFLEKLFFSIGFYKKKASIIQNVSNELITHYDGYVPTELSELLKLPGVGIKTARLVLAEGFGIPAICVDIHVHRISNRLGLVNTKTPEETDAALHKLIPKKYWAEINRLFVQWGQNICTPVSPKCSICPLAQTLCQQNGVTKKR